MSALGAFFHDGAVLQHQYAVSVLDSGEAVRHHDRGALSCRSRVSAVVWQRAAERGGG